MVSISKPKLLGLVIIILSVSVGWETYYVLGTPAPTVGRVVTPGDLGPCDYYIYLDGTTPVALFESHKGGTPGDNLLGTAGQDIAAFLNPITAANVEFCFSAQTFSIATSWVLTQSDTIIGQFNSTLFQATANNFDLVSIVHPGVAGTATKNLIFQGISFSANGHTNLNAINFNQSLNEQSMNNV